METEKTNVVALPELTELERSVLQRCGLRKFNQDAAPEVEQDAEISLIEKANAYESEADLVDERFDFTNDCNLLVWFASKYGMEVKLEKNSFVYE